MANDPKTGLPIPDAPAVPGVTVLQPPEDTYRQESHNSTTRTGEQRTTNEPAPQALEALEDLKEAQDAGLDAAGERFAGDARVLQVEADAAKRQVDYAQATELRRELARMDHEAKVREKQRIAEQRRAEMEKAAKPTTYWQDQSVPAKVLAVFATMLGRASQGADGRPNHIWESYKQEEDADRQRKVDAYVRSKEFVTLADNDIDAANQALTDKLAEINSEELVQSKIMDRQLLALTKSIGSQNAKAKYAEWRAAREADNAEKLAKEWQHYSTRVEGERTTTTRGGSRSHTQNVNDAKGRQTNNPLAVPNLRGQIVGRARTEKEAIELRDRQAETHSLRRDAQALQAHIKQHGNVLLPGVDTTIQRQREDLKQALVGHLTKDRATLTLQEAEWRRYNGMLTPRFWEDPDAAATVLDEIVYKAGVNYRNRLKSQNIDPDADLAPANPAPSAPAPRTEQPKAKPEASRKAVETREIGGKRYVRRGAEWFAL